jgi:hypothetical protein
MPKCGSATVQVVCLVGTNESDTCSVSKGSIFSSAINLGHGAATGTPTVTNMGLLLFSATRSTTHWAISRRRLATVAEQRRKVPQTAIEKIVQKYAVGLPDGKLVKAGDYVMIRPEHVMTHDNTGPVISKFVRPLFGGPITPPPTVLYNLSWPDRV